MFRRERVSELLLGFLAEELQKMRDPRLQLITLTEVTVSKDCKVARIYWSSLGKKAIESGEFVSASAGLDPKEMEQIQEGLKGVTSLLKRRMGEELELRTIPHLVFSYDESAVKGARIDELLKKAGV